MLHQNLKETNTDDLQDQISNSHHLSPESEPELSNDPNESDPTKKIGKWTPSEDELLRKYVPLFGEKQWRKISEHIPGRTSIQCLHRWTKILKPGLVKGPWTSEEDQKLLTWVTTEGATKWAQCSNFIQGRSGKQCRERWFNNLNPEVKKGNWTKEDDEQIYQLYQKHGSSWSKIAKLIPGRTENAIKNRFYSTLRKLNADKRKVGSEPNEDITVKGEEPEKVEPKLKESLDISNLSQPPNVLYTLLNEKTSVNPLEQDPAKEGSKGRSFNQDNQKENIRQPLKDPKLSALKRSRQDGKNTQKTTARPFRAELDENDNAFEDFLITLDHSIQDDFLTKEFTNPQRLDDLTQLDSLQQKILYYCQSNIKELANTFKSIANDNTDPSLIDSTAATDRQRNCFSPVKRPVSSICSLNPKPNLQQKSSNIRGTTILTPTPNKLQELQSTNQSLSSKLNGLNSSPGKGPSANAFSLYNPLMNQSKRSSQNDSENLSEKQIETKQTTIESGQPDTHEESKEDQQKPEDSMDIEKSQAQPEIITKPTATSPNNASLDTLAEEGQKLSSNGSEDTEKRMTFLFQQLYSLETLLAKTRNELVHFESSMKQKLKKNGDQENMKVEETTSNCTNGKSNQAGRQKAIERLDSEFEQILKKKKID